MNLQKHEKPPVNKGNLPGGTKKKNKKEKIEMTVPSSGKITNYLVRKNRIGEEDDRLKTGNNEDKVSMENTTDVEEDRREEDRKKKLRDRKIPSVGEETDLKKTTFRPVRKTHRPPTIFFQSNVF